MKLDSLRRRAALSTVTGLALGALASCTTSAHTASTGSGPSAPAAVPTEAVNEPFSEEIAAGLKRIRAATDTPPTGRWGHHRDGGGRIWYFWPLPDGRFCTGREVRLEEDSLTQEVDCTTNPLPGDGTPALHALHEASVHGGRWVVYLYADEEDVVDIACGDQHLTAERITGFPTPYGRRTLYAVESPWEPVGVLHARVRGADGGTAPAEVTAGPTGGPVPSHARACP
ncbi:hypothetical protein [Kitasatospora sp. NPDC085464]|uniref:hypothetical protein n=1 Tax=Kitasatospora sp. NPDC085464 TaxID=3364063 RepID=UPI0037CA4590